MDGLLLARPRAVLAIVAVAGLVAALVEPMTSRNEWVGYLPTTVSAFENTTLWLPLLLGGSAAWLAGQARAHGLDEWESASPRDHRERRRPVLVATICAAIVVHLIALAVIAIDSLRYGLNEGMDSAWMTVSIPTTIAYTVCWCALGTWMGSAWRRSIAIPVALVAPYATYAAFVLYLADAPIAGLAIADGRIFTYVRPTTGIWLARLAFWGALAVALVVRVVKGPTRWAHIVGTAASLAAAAAIFQGTSFEPVDTASTPVCEGSAPQVCLEDPMRTVLPQYRANVDELWPQLPTALRPTVVASETVDLTSLEPSSRDDPNGAVVIAPPVSGFNGQARLINSPQFATRFGDGVFLAGCTDTYPPDSIVSIVIWWRNTIGVEIGDSATISDILQLSTDDPVVATATPTANAIAAMSDDAREEWFTDHADDIEACRSIEVPS
jgi:hypothetical protein